MLSELRDTLGNMISESCVKIACLIFLVLLVLWVFQVPRNTSTTKVRDEGRGWLQGLAQGSVGGSMDDLNELLNHDFFQNATVTHENVFLYHPHLLSYICMHVEEIVQVMVQYSDSVQGMERFDFAYFPGLSRSLSNLSV